MARKLRNVENETQTLYDLEYGEKHWKKGGKGETQTVEFVIRQKNWKTWKMVNAHFRTWNMVCNTEKLEKLEMQTLGPGIWQETMKNMEYQKGSL